MNQTGNKRFFFAFAIIFALVGVFVTPVSSQEPIRIGATLSLTGTYEEPATMIHNGYRLWEKEINASGGLLGRPVELIVIDDKSNPELARKGYRELIEEKDVDFILSPYSTPITREVSEISEKHEYVLIACGAAGEVLWDRGYDYIFGMYVPAKRFFIGFFDLMARAGFDSVCIINENNPFNRDTAEGAAYWAKMMGVNVKKRIEFDPQQNTFTDIIRQIRSLHPDGFIISSYPPAGYELLEIMQNMHFRPQALGMTIAPVHPSFYEKVGSFANHIFAPSQWEPNERLPFPGTRQFIDDFTRYVGIKPSYHAGSAYASCQVLQKAVEDTGELDHTKIRDYISALDTVTVIGRFKVDETGKQVGHNPILIQWQDGKKEIVYPPHMSTAEPRFD
jgi:branched-chain amino acid transport system substrate-binding protein